MQKPQPDSYNPLFDTVQFETLKITVNSHVFFNPFMDSLTPAHKETLIAQTFKKLVFLIHYDYKKLETLDIAEIRFEHNAHNQTISILYHGEKLYNDFLTRFTENFIINKTQAHTKEAFIHCDNELFQLVCKLTKNQLEDNTQFVHMEHTLSQESEFHIN